MISMLVVHLAKTVTYLVPRLMLSPYELKRLPLDPHHLGIPSSAPKTITRPIVHLAQTVHRSRVEINTISKQTKTSFHLIHVTYIGLCLKRFLCPWNVLRKSHLSFIEINSLQMEQNELPLDPSHIWVPSSASKMISVPMVRLAQTMHLPCVDITTISKQTHIIHQVRPRRFPCMWHIRRKPCTYLVLTLPLSPNRPTSSIRCAQEDFLACGTFSANRASIFRWD
jgi:hypothetical protein